MNLLPARTDLMKRLYRDHSLACATQARGEEPREISLKLQG